MTTRAATPNANGDRWEYIKHLWIEEFRPLWFAPGLLLGICLGFVVGWLAHSGAAQEIATFFEGALPEIMSIGLTVTLLYYFDQWREDKREDKRLQEELLWQIRSRSNDVAISAIDRLRAKRWLHLLKRYDLTEVRWAGAGLFGIDLSGVNISSANLSGAEMVNANLSGANITSANFSGASMLEANLSGADLSRANLSGAGLWEANLSGAIMEPANLSGADMQDANLSGAFMRDADLSGAGMEFANLSGADIRRANLSGADMLLANLENANLGSVEFDETTILPDGTHWTPDTDMKRFTDPSHPDFWRSDNEYSPAYHSRSAEDAAETADK